MATLVPASQFKSRFSEPRISASCQYPSIVSNFISNPKVGPFFLPRRLSLQFRSPNGNLKMPMKAFISATTAEKPKKRYRGKSEGFVEAMLRVAIKALPTVEAKESEKEVKEPEEERVRIDGCLRFLVDNKLIYDTLEKIIEDDAYPHYAGLRNSGLQRSASLEKDLQWFREQGHTIPEPTSLCQTYAQYLKELSEKDSKAFICHFYIIFFTHIAGGKMIGREVAEKILNNKELECYKWDGDISRLLVNVGAEFNKVAEGWTREEKIHCLKETVKYYKFFVISISLNYGDEPAAAAAV